MGNVLGDEANIPEQSFANECDFELHAVGSQRASFICKNILYLSQLFVEGGGAYFGSFFSEGAVHELVVVDEVGLGHLDDFDGDYQRDGNHGVEKH